MGSPSRFATRFRYLKLLRVSLGAGALYDTLLASAMLTKPGTVGRWWKLPTPGPSSFLWFPAALLITLALLYLIAAYDVRRYSGIIAAAIAGRVLRGLVLGSVAIAGDAAGGLHWLAAGEFAMVASHTLLWWPIRA